MILSNYYSIIHSVKSFVNCNKRIGMFEYAAFSSVNYSYLFYLHVVGTVYSNFQFIVLSHVIKDL